MGRFSGWASISHAQNCISAGGGALFTTLFALYSFCNLHRNFSNFFSLQIIRPSFWWRINVRNSDIFTSDHPYHKADKNTRIKHFIHRPRLQFFPFFFFFFLKTSANGTCADVNQNFVQFSSLPHPTKKKIIFPKKFLKFEVFFSKLRLQPFSGFSSRSAPLPRSSRYTRP